MEMVPVISVEAVKRFARDLVEKCKARLLADGQLPRLCYVFTTTEKARAVVGESPSTDGAALVMLDLEADDEGLTTMLGITHPEFMAVATYAAVATGLAPEDFAKRTIAMWKKMTGQYEHTIVSKYVRAMVQKLDAYAFVHQSDTWHVEDLDRSRHPSDLSQDPDAFEAIAITVETHQYQEMLTVRYDRTARATGKITGFHEPVIMTSDAHFRLGGDLFDILKPIPMN